MTGSQFPPPEREPEPAQAPTGQPRIANREERQAFWTAILRDEGRPIDERLRASELLARSEADFLTRVQSTGLTLEQLIIESKKPKP